MGETITGKTFTENLMSVCPCIVEDAKRKNQLDATQWFIELMIRSTCFRHYYAHHQELETVQMFTARAHALLCLSSGA